MSRTITIMRTAHICLECGTNNTYIDKKGVERWIRDKRRIICKRCYDRQYNRKNPRKRKELDKKWNAIKNPKRLVFKGKRVVLSFNPRKGICRICFKQGKTHMHHLEYHEDDPLLYTIELCESCHSKEH
jgi:hypothetical protein